MGGIMNSLDSVESWGSNSGEDVSVGLLCGLTDRYRPEDQYCHLLVPVTVAIGKQNFSKLMSIKTYLL
jgi:hypothetical protein